MELTPEDFDDIGPINGPEPTLQDHVRYAGHSLAVCHIHHPDNDWEMSLCLSAYEHAVQRHLIQEIRNLHPHGLACVFKCEIDDILSRVGPDAEEK